MVERYSENSTMTTLEAKRIQKYVEDREKQNDVEKDLQVNTWKDVFAKVRKLSALDTLPRLIV